MIDRKRVRELKATQRKSSANELYESVLYLEELANHLVEVIHEIESVSPGPRDAFGTLLAWCIADDKLRSKGVDLAYIHSCISESVRLFKDHARIAEMRLKTRGRMSDERMDLANRLVDARCVFERFILLSPLFRKQLHDGPNPATCGTPETC